MRHCASPPAPSNRGLNHALRKFLTSKLASGLREASPVVLQSGYGLEKVFSAPTADNRQRATATEEQAARTADFRVAEVASRQNELGDMVAAQKSEQDALDPAYCKPSAYEHLAKHRSRRMLLARLKRARMAVAV